MSGEKMRDLLKFILKYLRKHLLGIVVFVGSMVIFSVVFYLYNLQFDIVFYPIMLCNLMAVTVTGFGIGSDYKRHKRMQSLLKSESESINELMNKPEIQLLFHDSVSQDYIEVIRKLLKEISRQTTTGTKKIDDTIEYYTMWAHQIKTPIASMRLKLEGEDSDFARGIRSDLFRIEQYVDMVLTYLRLDSSASDYVMKACDLDTIIRDAVKKFAPDFISKKLRCKCEPAKVMIVTDEKWLSFVLEQVISNSVKYTNKGEISIYYRNKTLCISDTGIGIDAADLPRIMEKGYTGFNGRKDKKASGIGLYLCKRICKNLGYKMWIESEPMKGTSVYIDMSGSSLAID